MIRIFVLCFLIISSIQGQMKLNYTVEKISDGFQFVEGPVWKEGVGLLFSDIPANTVYKWTLDSEKSVYLKPSGNSNGLALDKEGRLLLAQHGKRRLARLENDRTETSLASMYNGKKLNSPNDIAVKSDGSIFFTDPPYGINQNEEELKFYGIFRISPSGNLSLLDKSLNRPNGICFSPDEKKLYVCDSDIRKIYIWDVVDDSTISNKREFAFMSPDGNADGMKVDLAGNLFATGPGGVWVYQPDGILLGIIKVPGQTTNCNWGNEERTILFITSGNEVFRAQVTVTDNKI